MTADNFNQAEQIFLDASKLSEKKAKKLGYMNPTEFEFERLFSITKKFKRSIFPLPWYFGPFAVTKDLDELAGLLYKSGVVLSTDEGKNIMPNILEQKIHYSYFDYLVITPVWNYKGEKAYKIRNYYT